MFWELIVTVVDQSSWPIDGTEECIIFTRTLMVELLNSLCLVLQLAEWQTLPKWFRRPHLRHSAPRAGHFWYCPCVPPQCLHSCCLPVFGSLFHFILSSLTSASSVGVTTQAANLHHVELKKFCTRSIGWAVFGVNFRPLQEVEAIMGVGWIFWHQVPFHVTTVSSYQIPSV